MHDLEKIRQFLLSFPGWDGELTVDYTDGRPGSCGLYFTGVEERFRQTDVQGNALVCNRYHFVLRRIAVATAGQAQGAQWLMDLQNWIQQQSAAGNTPRLGCLPDREQMASHDAKLLKADTSGCAVYQLRLWVEFCTYQEGWSEYGSDI